jgi:hypothetical protein
VIFALAIAGASLLAVFAITMLILFISMAIADHSYIGKHRYADKSSPSRRHGSTRTYTAHPHRSADRGWKPQVNTTGGRRPARRLS